MLKFLHEYGNLKRDGTPERSRELPTCGGDHLLHKDARALQVVDWEVHSRVCARGGADAASQRDVPRHHRDGGGLHRTDTGHGLLVTLQRWLPVRGRQAHSELGRGAELPLHAACRASADVPIPQPRCCRCCRGRDLRGVADSQEDQRQDRAEQSQRR